MVDRDEALRRAAQARHAATLRRAEDALRTLAGRGEPITFRRLAQTAGVSRSWLYRQTELRAEIERLRQPRPSKSRPALSQRATVDSLRQQLHAYREELSRLRTQNQVLHDQLARHLGAARAASITRP